MIASFIKIKMTELKGRGVFADCDIEADSLIEESPVIVLNSEERALVEKTNLNNYIFEWGEDNSQCVVALGYIEIYNHSYRSNCEYEMDFEKQVMRIKSVRKISAGEELTVNYNGDWNDETEVWFEVKE